MDYTEVNQNFGALVEGVHLATYTLERAFKKMEALLVDNRWKAVGGGYDDINAFLETIKLDSFKIVAAERQKIAKRIKELQPQAANRQIAKVLGVHESTVRSDTAENPAPAAKKASNAKGSKASPAGNPAPAANGAAAPPAETQPKLSEFKSADGTIKPLCNFNGEDPNDVAEPGDTPEMIRRTIFLYRASEALRHAREHGFDKAADAEITDEIVKLAKKTAEAWVDQAAALERRQLAEVEAAGQPGADQSEQAAQRKAKRGGRRVAKVEAGQPEAAAPAPAITPEV
jgi:hypothetical protein